MKNYKPTIVVFGCTGTVGLEVLSQLIEKDCMVRGVLRHPDRKHPIKITNQIPNLSYVSADLKSSKQLISACKGADYLFLLTGTAPNQVKNEINIIDAAKEAGITRIVKLSAPVVPSNVEVEVSNWHREIEKYLSESGIDYCCLRPYAFMQNWERNTFTIQRFGKIFGALGSASKNYVDCRDVAEIAVHYLLSSNALEGKFIPISGAETISNYEMAERLSHVTGRAIEYVDISPKELFDQLTKRAKLPNWLANHIVELDNFSNQVQDPTENTIQVILNRKPRMMATYLQESKTLFEKKSILNFWS